MAHLSAQLAELVLLPAPVTLFEMSDCVGAVSYIVALVLKGTSSVAIFFPYDQTKHLDTRVVTHAAGQGFRNVCHDRITILQGVKLWPCERVRGRGGEGAANIGVEGVHELVILPRDECDWYETEQWHGCNRRVDSGGVSGSARQLKAF